MDSVIGARSDRLTAGSLGPRSDERTKASLKPWPASSHTARQVPHLGAAAVVVCLASSYLKAGLAEDALSTAGKALNVIEQTGARMSAAELCRLKGEALLSRGAPFDSQAQACFEQAIAIARQQEAKSWELRAVTSLARLLARRGRRDEARAMLAEIYGWFIEGFDTSDLKEAKALLEEFSG